MDFTNETFGSHKSELLGDTVQKFNAQIKQVIRNSNPTLACTYTASFHQHINRCDEKSQERRHSTSCTFIFDHLAIVTTIL